MTYLGGVGDFTEAVLGLAFSFGCALLMAYGCLRFLVGLMTRQQYNVTVEPNPSNDLQLANDPSHVRSILWLGAAVASADAGTGNNGGSVATSGPYILPAATPNNSFARIAKPDDASGGRLVEIPHFAADRVAQIGHRDGWVGDTGDAA
jgi:hypothetical protein